MLYCLYKIAEFLIKLLPLKWGYALAVGIADLKYFASVKDKAILVRNLKLALGIDTKLAKSHARSIFRNFCKYLVDFIRQDALNRKSLDKFIKVSGIEYLDEALEEGKGVLLLSAHIGNWELGAAVVGLLGYPLNIIALSHNDKRVNAFFDNRRKAMGPRVVPLGGSIKKCFRALDRNEAIAILADRDFSNSDFIAEFFGRDTTVPKGVGIFNVKKGSPIVPCFMIRKPDDTYEFTFEKPVCYKTIGRQAEDVKGAVEASLKIIEKYARRYPNQWFMFGEIWPEARQ